jgi:hypothetical protein
VTEYSDDTSSSLSMQDKLAFYYHDNHFYKRSLSPPRKTTIPAKACNIPSTLQERTTHWSLRILWATKFSTSPFVQDISFAQLAKTFPMPSCPLSKCLPFHLYPEYLSPLIQSCSLRSQPRVRSTPARLGLYVTHEAVSPSSATIPRNDDCGERMKDGGKGG